MNPKKVVRFGSEKNIFCLCRKSNRVLLVVQLVVQVFMEVRCTPGLLLSFGTDRQRSQKDLLLKGPRIDRDHLMHAEVNFLLPQ